MKAVKQKPGSDRTTPLSRNHAVGWASVSVPTLIVDVEIDDHLSVSGYPAKFTFNCMIPAQ
jgi:hypothetical protein